MKVIIVGGGLAGLCLAHELEKHKISFKIIDENINFSSNVAAGMINPMTFRRMIKTWKGDELIPVLKSFYPAIEEKIGERFFFPTRLRRAFASTHERELWIERLDDPEYSDFINPPESEENTPNYIKNTFGNAFINTPGYVDAKKFMQSNHAYFLKSEKLAYASFDFDQLDIQNKTYQGEPYTHLIFAEGYRGEDNPFFGYLPFKNAKGELLTIESDAFNKDEILNRKCYILPTENGDFKLGSTYSWGTKDPSTTDEAKQELLDHYEELNDAPFKITAHEAGIRPASADRRPMVGEHPEHKGLYIFNGLGAKGYMIAPFFAIEFINFINGMGELDNEVNIKRFYNKHYKK
ncbi:MAG TPA: FAD-dependent oxidoreductase [Brumimicrobium sp.]|nr:FAD-dependent oxidoreductase [Brumimicrobium sp.]